MTETPAIEGEFIPQYIKPPDFRRPPKFTPKELADGACDFFTERLYQAKPFTWSGIAIFMGIARETLDNYLKGEVGKTPEIKQQYRDVCIWAKSVIEHEREELLVREKGNVAGIVFALKWHHGWRDDKYIHIDQTERHELVVMLPHVLADKLSDAAGERIGTEVALPTADPTVK